MSSPMKRGFSALDYTITISRKYRYLVVGSSEFGFQVASGALDLGRLSPDAIGHAVLTVLASVDSRLQQLRREGREPPPPRSKLERKESVGAASASAILGVSAATLRRMVERKLIDADRTPGGHLRFRLEALSDYLMKRESNRHEQEGAA